MAVVRRGPLLDHLDQIEEECSKGEITLARIFTIFGNDGHFLLVFFLILPFLQPLPLFGLSTPFGLLIAVVAFFYYLRRPPMLPKKWATRKLPGPTVVRIAEGSERIFERLSRFIYPRWKLFFQEPFRFINLALVVLNAVLLALPLPFPFSNALPAWMILFQALGHLEEDGALILLSYIQTLICLAYFTALTFGVISGVEWLGFMQ